MTTDVEQPSVELICQLLRRRRFRYRSELELHDGIAALFDAHGVDFSREVPVPGGRIDFVIADIALEVKIKGSAQQVSRQARRYADTGMFSAVMVATTRPAHQTIADPNSVPPISVVTLGGLGL
ncbi:hypothetical protein [Gordonia sihwensis]|uniref:hypothetical protein n=1 Tax=Gordonia sihwensis TaxID=173559 RepID=UPI003D986F79